MPRNPAALFLALALFSPLSAVAQQSRIASRIDNNRRITLSGHLHPKALAGADQGPVDPALKLPRLTLMLHPTASQQSDFDQLLAQQQDPASPNYHHWLTPEQFADRFGVSQADLSQITAWLGTQNLNVVEVAPSRNWIAVSGTAGSVQQAFGLDIHHYLVNGELRYANANEPSIPAALQGLITAIHGLNDFRMKPVLRLKALRHTLEQPQYTDPPNQIFCDTHCIGPDDLATIYNFKPLLNAGLDGSGQTIVVVGQTDLVTADIQAYRSFFNLTPLCPSSSPCFNLEQTLVGADPGISITGDLGEADLDIELAGAVARNATINFVYSANVFDALQYAIAHNLAPIISMSYGDCEASFPSTEAQSWRQAAQQANAEGITWFAASGDNGATDCYGDGTNQDNVVSVDLPASIPEVTGIGGNEFNEGTGNYWSATNTANNASALSYIPEIAWNDSVSDGSPSASGGGASIYFSKPSWQTGKGVPGDGARDVPDLAISASADHDSYLMYTSDSSILTCNSRRGGSNCPAQVLLGGTSAGAPFFAGLAALLNQQFISKGYQSSPGLGNINPILYGLFQSTPSVYHDVTTGNNIIDVTCGIRQRGCTAGPVGYNAGPGYDQVTGLGSVDANALMTAWMATLTPHTTPPGPPSIGGVENNASGGTVYAPGEIISIFGANFVSVTQPPATSLPLPKQMAGVTVTVNGYQAPLWYVSPTQINAQIPYEVQTGNATLVINSTGGSGSFTLPVAAAAPGIYVNQNAPVGYTSAARGQTVTLYVTGVGLVSPLPADGAAPATGTLPAPVQTVTVTVGGVTAQSVAGIPSWATGILQINCQVPASVPLGAQAVVVKIGTVASNAATLNVTQ